MSFKNKLIELTTIFAETKAVIDTVNNITYDGVYEKLNERHGTLALPIAVTTVAGLTIAGDVATYIVAVTTGCEKIGAGAIVVNTLSGVYMISKLADAAHRHNRKPVTE